MSLRIEDPDNVRQSIAEVHSSSSSTNWVLCGRRKGSKNVMQFVGKGSGGLRELSDHLVCDEHKDMLVMYGLIDLGNSSFIFINWYNCDFEKRTKSYSREISVMFMPYQSWINIDLKTSSQLEDILRKYSSSIHASEKGPIPSQSITV